MLMVGIIVAVIVIAAGAVAGLFYTGSGSVSVELAQSSAVTSEGNLTAAGTPVTLNATVTTSPLVSAGGLTWNFGDQNNGTSSGNSITHTYANPGTYLVLASTSLNNGKTISNAGGLFGIQIVQPSVSNPSPFGTTSSYSIIILNTTASPAGAPAVASGSSVKVSADVQQAPTFQESNGVVVSAASPVMTSASQSLHLTNGTYKNYTWSNYTWVNETWNVNQIVLNWGDGSSPIATTSSFTDAQETHTYSNAGFFTATAQTTTQNYTQTEWLNYTEVSYNGPTVPGGWQNNTTANSVTSASVGLAGQSNTATTVYGYTFAVGAYSLPTITVQNPGTIVNMEAEVGGYFSLDPAIDYESVGFEVIANVYQTLLSYNGTHTDQFIPTIASGMPTYTQDYLNYTFTLRKNIYFSNGDPITPWDVKYSYTRTMLMDSGAPFPPGWIFSQFTVPGIFVPSGAIDPATFAAINNSVTIDTAANTVSFHLDVPAPPLVFEQVVADPLGGAIMDHAWLEAHGPALVWTPSGFSDYSNLSFEPSYINAWRNSALGSGPFEIQYENNPYYVILVPNPKYQVLANLPAPHVQKVVLEYVQSDSTRELALTSGKADLAGIPTTHWDVVANLESQHLVSAEFFQTLNLFWWNFNFNVYSPGGKNIYGNTIPADFFVDINVRKAFFNAFDFAGYISKYQGNPKYGVSFGSQYNGMIPNGMIGYQNLTNYNVFDMNLAKKEFYQSYWAQHINNTVTIAINVEAADSVDQAAALEWSNNLKALDPGHLIINVVPVPFATIIGNSVAWQDPMSIYMLGWLPDYPFPTDYTLPMLLPSTTGAPFTPGSANGGTYPDANNLNIPYFASDANGTNQVANLTIMYNAINDSVGVDANNQAAIIRDSQIANWMSANLTIYIPMFQQKAAVIHQVWLSGVPLEANPVLGGTDLLYNLLSKGSGTSAATVSSVMPSAIGSLSFLGSVTAAPLVLVGAGGWDWEQRRRNR